MQSYFVNVVYNYKSPTGQSKFCWSVKEFDLSKKISDQLYVMLEEIGHAKDDVFNLNLTAFTPVGSVEKDDALVAQMLEALEMVIADKAPSYHDCIDDGEAECAWCIARKAIAAARGAS